MLDDCEHLIAATAEPADVLPACQGSRVPVTGRKALGITGEAIPPMVPPRPPPRRWRRCWSGVIRCPRSGGCGPYAASDAAAT
ncbi:hypothetical protein ABZU32_34320 [Sphaerisporangium sp. NPDC005288]|uniref:hypothetical protein n=1 Tax=Sphaerisporangium sp. NPDC005288 TaxID=3155114 RepID=UPI0033BF9E66